MISQTFATKQSDNNIDPSTISNILKLAKFGIARKDILSSFGSGRSSRESHIELLISLGLVQIESIPQFRKNGTDATSLLFTTEKGFKFLRCYSTLVELSGGIVI